MRRQITLFAVLLTWGASCFAQGGEGRLFGMGGEPSNSFTNSVLTDHDGFVWVATRNGLFRYDGYHFRVFKKGGPEGLAHNGVNCMKEDLHHRLYVGLYSALQVFDGSEFHDIEAFDLQGKPFKPYVTCILELDDGTMLVGTSGHGVMKIDVSGQCRQIGGDMKDIVTVSSMTEDADGKLWMTTDRQGVLVCKDGKVVARHFSEGTLSAGIRNICQDMEGRIYLGTMGHGVLRQDMDGCFRHIEATESRNVADLYCAHDGTIMIGYSGRGLAIYDPRTGQTEDNPYFSNELDMSLVKVSSIMEDNSGNVWLGMLQKGVYMYPALAISFNYMGIKAGTRNLIGQACVTSCRFDGKGRVWIGTDMDGIYLYDLATQTARHFSEGVPQTVLSMTEDPSGRMWLGSFTDGIGWLDPATGFYHRQNLPQGNAGGVFAMKDDQKGNIWLGTMGSGLLKLDTKTGEVRQYVMTTGADNDPGINSIANNYISGLSISPDGKRVYAATTMGLCCLDVERDSWISTFGRNCLLYGTKMRCVKEYDGRVWVGTFDGLLCYDLLSNTQSMLTMVEGLSDNGVASIEQDWQGKLWIATDHGLCRYDPKTGGMECYFDTDGLQSNEFSDGASCISGDGMMVFGGVKGISWFNPADIESVEWNARTRLITFLLDGEVVTPTTRSGHWQVCDTLAIACRKFHLSHRDNSFSLQFSTLTYENPDQISYFYTINGETPIRMLPGQNELPFLRLAPGEYTFRVWAEKGGQQSEAAEFAVVVHSPWWLTVWAFAVYAVLVVVLAFCLVTRYRRREKEKRQMQENIHAKEIGEAKVRFFMNISHEIRTPLTLIMTPLTALIKNDKDARRSGIYQTMRRNAERILSLVNQLMDLRKIDKGMMVMRMQETDLIGFIDDIYSLFGHQAKAKSITFSFSHADEKLPIWLDINQFDKVMVNILSNAFKFTHSGGEVTIEVTRTNDKFVSVSVSDNGEKIPEERLDTIFKRFYQVPSTVNDRNTGTGIGLDLTRSLVELHHGSIKAENLSEGCRFIVTLPLGNGHLRPEEIMVDSARTEEPMTWEEEELLFTDEEGGRKKRPSVIIAEDDEEIGDYLKRELGEDYDVTVCVNGREALAAALKTIPDLVVSDVMMPEMDGNTLCATLKSNPQTSHVPIVMLTAKSRDEDQLEGLQTGADSYIVKPFNMDILKQTIANLISSRRQLKLKFGRNDQLEETVEKVEVKSPDEKLLERLMKVINEELSNSDLNVDYIAKHVGISRVHLHRKVKELTGQTPHDFVRNIRLKQAAELLSSGDMNVSEVMYACGFANPASFSTVFKKFYGMSPREYMQRHLEPQEA